MSPREEELLGLASEGLTDEAIAVSLGISVATIRGYWLRIRTKLGGSGRAQLVGQWVQQNSDSRNKSNAQNHQEDLDANRDQFELILANERAQTDLLIGQLDDRTREKIESVRRDSDASIAENKSDEGGR